MSLLCGLLLGPDAARLDPGLDLDNIRIALHDCVAIAVLSTVAMHLAARHKDVNVGRKAIYHALVVCGDPSTSAKSFRAQCATNSADNNSSMWIMIDCKSQSV